MPVAHYTKPWRTHAELVQLLEDRGLIVTDRASAERFFANVSYYRISGYCLAFERLGQRHSFVLGTTFENIRGAYEFDFGLRDLVNEALEMIEIDLRTTVAHHFGQKHGAFGHTNSDNFFNPPKQYSGRTRSRFLHHEWLEGLRSEVCYSKEPFVVHFRNAYIETSRNHDLPIWALAEIMSFGDVSKMIAGMLAEDQRVISSRYGIQPHILVSWIHHLYVARNVCAHHGRLWDRFWTVQPELPAGNAWKRPFLQDNRRLSVTVIILFQMLKRIDELQNWADRWQVRMRKKLSQLPFTQATSDIGFTDEWFQNPVWN